MRPQSRPFTIELKTKRRASTAAAFNWGAAAAVLAPEPPLICEGSSATRDPEPRFGTSVSAPGKVLAQSSVRRVLPDLRVDDSASSAQVPDLKSRRKVKARVELGSTNRDVDKPVPDRRNPTEASSAPVAASGAKSEDTRSRSMGSPAKDAVVDPASRPALARKWARPVASLRRGERWKRRLPDVCR
jgi:hypothetical protein